MLKALSGGWFLNDKMVLPVKRLGLTSLLLFFLFSSCDAHDYWLMSDAVEVDSEQGVYGAKGGDTSPQDLFVRYEFDYEVENMSVSNDTEVVVSATSYVNGVARATGQKVWHLEPESRLQGVLMPTQLSYGNSLEVSLECCRSSRCSAKEVVSVALSEEEDVSATAAFCYDSCMDTASCLLQCPTDESCAEVCEDLSSQEACREEICRSGDGFETCAVKCQSDAACLVSCVVAPECEDECISKAGGCFKNCLATAYLYTGNVYSAESPWIPCSLCGGEGRCKVNFGVSEARELESEKGEHYSCNLDCSRYPSVCVTGCQEMYASDSERMACLNTCLVQQLYWCNDYLIPEDYIDNETKQPCCYSDYCKNRLTGVVKSYGVDCFNDTNCASGSYCSYEGVCESSGSGCNAAILGKRSPLSEVCIVFVLFGLLVFERRRRYA